jgi:protein-tyrosine phosphatase
MINSHISLIPASETVLHDYLFHYLDIEELCIRNTSYLLLELPYTKKWDKRVYELLDKLISYYNVIPIIAHVERYPAVKKNKKCIKKLIDRGCVIQLNTTSIIDKSSRRRVVRYIKHGYIDVLGSDCHNTNKRPPVITDALKIVIQKVGVRYYNEFEQNSEYIVNGIKLSDKIIDSIYN